MKRRRWMWWSLAVLACAAIAWWVYPDKSAEELATERRWAVSTAQFEKWKPQAEGGDPEAQFAVAEAYRTGAGTRKDPTKAAEWYAEAANRGHIEAQYQLGRLYERGEGVPRDALKAAEWYRLAARIGRHSGAEFALGELYYTGRGVPTDYEEAVDWYSRAARAGHPGGQFIIGLAYADGWGVKHDLVEAYKWLTLALPHRAEILRINRDYDPEKAREMLVKRMHRFQIEQGAKRASAWRPETRDQATVVRPGTTLVHQRRDTPPKKEETPVTVLSLGGIDAMITGSDRSTQRVTLLVSVPKPDDVSEVCMLLPRIQDAVVQEFARQPVRKSGADLILKDVHGRLLDPINRALGRPMINRAFVVATDRPLTPNLLYLTPFENVTDCDRWTQGAAFRK